MKNFWLECAGSFLLVFFLGLSLIAVDSKYFIISMGVIFLIALFCYSLFWKLGKCHLNPVISFAFLLRKKITGKEFLFKFLFQLLGAFIAMLLLFIIFSQVSSERVELAYLANTIAGGELFIGTTTTICFLAEIFSVCVFVFIFLVFALNAKYKKYLTVAVSAAMCLAVVISYPVSGSAIILTKTISAAICSAIFSGTSGFLVPALFFALTSAIGTLVAIFFYSIYEKASKKTTAKVEPSAKPEKDSVGEYDVFNVD